MSKPVARVCLSRVGSPVGRGRSPGPPAPARTYYVGDGIGGALAVNADLRRDAENLLAVLLTREDGVCVVEGELDLDLGPEFELVFGQSWLDMEPTMEPTTIVRWMS